MRRALQSAVLVGALVLMSGCAVVDHAGAAATVDGQRLTTTQLSDEFTRLDTALGSQPKPATMDQLNRVLLTLWIGDRVMQRAVALNHLSIDKVATGKLHRQIEQQVGGAAKLDAYVASKGVPPNWLWMVLGNSVLTTQLGAKLIGGTDTTAQDNAANAYLQKLAETMDIQVAPRFGAWENSQMVVAATPNDLSVPVSPTSSSLG